MRGALITVRCDCGGIGYVPYDERWECDACGRRWNTGQIPAEEYWGIMRDMRRMRITVLTTALALVVPIAVAIPLAVVMTVPIVPVFALVAALALIIMMTLAIVVGTMAIALMHAIVLTPVRLLPAGVTVAIIVTVATVLALAINVTGPTTITQTVSVGPNSAGCTPSPGGATCQLTLALPAGTYTGEVLVTTNNTSMTVPVTLTVATAAETYFDSLPGAIMFSMITAAPNPPANQVFQIRNAGSGTLNWTLTPLTADGGLVMR